jgi:hypothetical protein
MQQERETDLLTDRMEKIEHKVEELDFWTSTTILLLFFIIFIFGYQIQTEMNGLLQIHQDRVQTDYLLLVQFVTEHCPCDIPQPFIPLHHDNRTSFTGSTTHLLH